MLQNRLKLYLILSLFVLTACGTPIPDLKNIDLDAWKHDRGACTGARKEMLEAIEDQKESLLKLDELDIVKLLGKPDENELLKRNQKIYRFFLTPSASCANHQNEPLKLVIRFNAMGLAKDVTIE